MCHPESTYERDPSLDGPLGSSCQYSTFLSCLGSSSQPSTNYYFPHRTLFRFISPHRPATWAGSRAGSPVSVSLAPLKLLDVTFPIAVNTK